jgi:iron complex transport system substrate-binding protein
LIFGVAARHSRPFIAACLLACSLPAWPAEIVLDQADTAPLSLSAPAERIITLAPNLAELAYAAGAGNRLIATVEYSDFPEAAANLPRIGDAFRLDSERIVTLKPDLVIAWASGNPQAAIDQLRSLGLPVWSVEIREPEQIADTLEALGRAAGQEVKAQQAAANIRSRLTALAGDYRDAPVRSYFYQVGERPLFTINDDHLISKGLRLCGGVNVFAGEPGLAFQVGHESVIVADPDVLFAPDLENGESPLSAWFEWPSMKAVRQGSMFLLPADAVSRASPRFLDALELACKLLHDSPERGADGQPDD